MSALQNEVEAGEEITVDTDSVDSTKKRNVKIQVNFRKSNKDTQTEELSLRTVTTQSECITHERYTQASMSFFSDIRDTEQLTCCTGLNSFELFNAIYVGVKTYIDSYCPQLLVGQTLSCRDQVLLTLMKMKQNLSFTLLSVFFRVARRTCARSFRRMIKVFSIILKNFIRNPTRNSIQDNLPTSFSKFATCRFVIDCTEVPVCKPACIRCRTQTYSFYYGRHTLKILVGVTPDGVISFLSPFYGGKASDKFIFNESGILQQCEAGDAVMLDKGFRVDAECANCNVKMFQPTFKELGRQLSEKDCDASREISSARVHVERIMERLKNFQILKDEIEWHYLGNMNDIIVSIAGLVNLSPPILGPESFAQQ